MGKNHDSVGLKGRTEIGDGMQSRSIGLAQSLSPTSGLTYTHWALLPSLPPLSADPTLSCEIRLPLHPLDCTVIAGGISFGVATCGIKRSVWSAGGVVGTAIESENGPEFLLASGPSHSSSVWPKVLARRSPKLLLIVKRDPFSLVDNQRVC